MCILDASTGTAYFRNSWYNSNVEPNSSTTFNYMVDDCSGIPDEFVLCQTRTEKGAGYDVSIKVNETWGNSFNGEIILQNNTESAIEAWELMVDTNFTITEITNSWAATVTELEPYSYMLKGTYTGFVPANSSVALGFTGVMDGKPEISNYSLTEVVVDENLFKSPELTDTLVDGDFENDTVCAEAIYDSENENINISWTATSPGTFFEIYVSDDNINYELYKIVDGNIFNTLYNTADDFLIKYFKVKQISPYTKNVDTICSNICYAVYTANDVNWKEYLRPWTIDDSNEELSKINTDDNPYKLSLEFNAAGIPDIHLNVVESYYTNALNNNAVLGMASEIIYKEDLKIQDLVVKFEINEDYIDNELGILENNSEFSDIKRLNVFKYFEDINMLLPIETKFDLTNNIVYSEVDEPGTYCIVDMEKWLSQFDIDIDKLNALSATPSFFSLRSDETEDVSVNSFVAENADVSVQDNSNILLTNENVINANVVHTVSDDSKNADINTSNSDMPINVFFILQSAGEIEEYFLVQKEMILSASEMIFSTYTNARIYVIGFKHNNAEFLKNNDSEPDYFSSIDEMDCLNNYEYEIYEDGYVNRTPAYEKLLNEVEYRENSRNFAFTIYNGSTDCQGVDQIDVCRDENVSINYSEILATGLIYVNTERASNVLDEVIKSNGLCIIYDENSANIIYNHICDNIQLNESENIEDKIYFGMDWSEMNLSVPLQVNGTNDTDSDGLTDWKEVDSNFLENTGMMLYDNETITSSMLPSAWYMLKSKYNCIPYRYINSNNFEIFEILNMIKVLPVISNPTKESSADDGVNDFDKLKPECIFDKYKSEYYNENAEYYDYYNDSNYYYEHLDDYYKQKKVFKSYTVEGLLLNYKTKKTENESYLNDYNSESNPVHYAINENTISISTSIVLIDANDNSESDSKVYNISSKEFNYSGDNADYTFKELTKLGLERYWSKNTNDYWEGDIFNFYPGMQIYTNLSVELIESNESSSKNNSNLIYIYLKSENKNSVTSGKNIYLYLYSMSSTLDFQRTVAHEFGHILKLGDYYSYAGDEIPIINSVQLNSEILADGLMNSNKIEVLETSANDIEMMLYGAIYNRWQSFIPNYENELSKALREKIIYKRKSCNTKYTWVHEKYFIPVYGEILNDDLFKYVIDDGKVTILEIVDGLDKMEKYEIPMAIDGYKVNKISSDVFYGNSYVKTIIVPETCVEINDYAFKGCENLEIINLPEGVTTIKKDTFSDCKQLKNISVPNTVQIIDWAAFAGSGLERVKIPCSVKTIDTYAFNNCKNLATVEFNEGLEEIGQLAFNNCQKISNIKIPASVSIISDSSFNECVSLKSITVDEKNNYFCSDVAGALFNKEKTILIQYPACSTANIYQIPDGITKINNSAFYGASNLKSITIPESVEEIGNCAFWGCVDIVDIVIPENIHKIGIYAFNCCWWNKKGSITFKRTESFEYDSDALINCNGVIIKVPESAKNLYIKNEINSIFNNITSDRIEVIV